MSIKIKGFDIEIYTNSYRLNHILSNLFDARLQEGFLPFIVEVIKGYIEK